MNLESRIAPDTSKWREIWCGIKDVITRTVCMCGTKMQKLNVIV